LADVFGDDIPRIAQATRAITTTEAMPTTQPIVELPRRPVDGPAGGAPSGTCGAGVDCG